jgi:heat shock protein HslJ
MGCEPYSISEQEQAFIAAFDHVSNYVIAGDQLTLTDSAGTTSLVFRSH